MHRADDNVSLNQQVGCYHLPDGGSWAAKEFGEAIAAVTTSHTPTDSPEDCLVAGCEVDMHCTFVVHC